MPQNDVLMIVYIRLSTVRTRKKKNKKDLYFYKKKKKTKFSYACEYSEA